MKFFFQALVLMLPLTGCVSVSEASLQKPSNAKTVKATWYGIGDKPNSHTACGAKFNPHGLTMAHRTIKCGTRVRITNPKNGKSVVGHVNDRGPAKWTGVEIDLTYGTARAIGMSGTQHVQMEKLD